MITGNAEVIAYQTEIALRAGVVSFTKGPPGCGKSSIHRAIAAKFNLKFIDIRLAQCEPPDLLGFPNIRNGRSAYLPPESIPLETDEIPPGYDGWYLLFDEANSADKDVQAAFYKIALDRMVDQTRIHERCVMACAGNREEDGAIVEDQSSALLSRMIHLNMVSDLKCFQRWANSNDIDHRITDYLNFKPTSLNTFNPDKLGLDSTYACERTWEFVSKLLEHIDPEDSHALGLIAGTVGEGVAREFISYCRLYQDLPKIEDILRTPSTIPVPSEDGTKYAMTGSIAHNADESNIENLMVYLRRMPIDYQVVCLRQISRRKNDLLRTPPVLQWMQDHQKEFTE